MSWPEAQLLSIFRLLVYLVRLRFFLPPPHCIFLEGFQFSPNHLQVCACARMRTHTGSGLPLTPRPMMRVCPASPQPASPTPGVRCFLMHFPKVCQQPCDKGQSRLQHRAPSRSYLHPSVGSILITNTLVVVSQGDKGDGPAGFFTSHCLPCPNPRFHFPHSSESDL